MNQKVPQRLRGGWNSVELREIGRIVTGSTPPKTKTEYYGGSFPFVKPPELRHGPVNDAEDKLSDKGAEVADVAPAGSVLVSCIGNLGKTRLATQPVAFNQQINAIIPNDLNASKWIFYAVQTSDFASQLASVASATTIAIVNKGKFSGLRIPLAPEEEQREIVAEIERQFTRLEAGVAGLRRVQANLKRYRASVLKAACEGKLVPTEADLAREKEKVAAASRRWSSEENQSRDGSATQEGPGYETGAQLLERILTERRQKWNGKGTYKEPAKPNTADLPPLPEGWAWAAIDQLALIGSGNTPPRITDFLSAGGDVPWFKVGDMNHPENLRIMRVAENYLSRASVEQLGLRLFLAGTIIFPKRGGAIATNKKRILETNATTDLNVMGLTPNSSVQHYLWWWFCSLDLATFSDGSNVPQINNKDILPISVPLPPFPEQQRIVAEVERRLSVVEELEAAVNANLHRATRLRQSILKRAFEGSDSGTA